MRIGSLLNLRLNQLARCDFSQSIAWILSLVTIGIYVFGFGLNQWKSNKAHDFYQFWLVGEAIRTLPISNIYSKQDQEIIKKVFLRRALDSGTSHFRYVARSRTKQLELIGTPFLYSVFSLISTGNYDFDYKIFRHLSSFLYVAAIIFFCLHLRLPALSIPFFIFVFTQFFWAFKSDVHFGNVSQIQLFLLALYLFIKKRGDSLLINIACGLFSGLLLFFKPNLIYIILVFIVWSAAQKDYKKLSQESIGFVFAGLIAVALPYLLFGNACSWGQWIKPLDEITFTNYYVRDSLLGCLFKVNNKPFFILMEILLLSLFAAVITSSNKNGIRVRSKTMDTDINFLFMGTGICHLFLANPMIHDHYFILFIPLILFFLTSAITEMGRQLFSIPAVVNIFIIAFIFYHSKPLRWHELSDQTFLLYKYLGVGMGLVVIGFSFFKVPSNEN